jgi:ABC-type Na+ efflux pump permease subunit
MVYLGAGMAAASMYNANQTAKKQASAANAAAEAQKAVGLAQIEAPLKAEAAAAETAKAQLKLRQASKSNTILTGPLTEQAKTTAPSILGVPS